MNTAILIGRLGHDPEVRYTASGTAVCNFNMATEERWTDQGGEKQKRTDWHRIVSWRKTAENVGEYLHKGSRVGVTGKLRTREWEDRDGVKRYVTEIIAAFVEFLDPANGNGNNAKPKADPLGGPVPEDTGEVPEDDIPF